MASNVELYDVICQKLHDEGIYSPSGYASDPRWSEVGKVHDWRNYVPQCVQEAWDEINLLGRVSILLIAVRQANNENWD